MNAYVIQKDDGMFVAAYGSRGSYTNDLTKARVFPTRDAAKADGVCGNERVVNVMDVLTTGTKQENWR